jgi:hypothetical protein
LDIPTHGFLGFHSSDLPQGRGGAPINWSIIHGESELTISLFRYTPGVDAGDIVTKTSIPIEERDDVRTVIDRLGIAACDGLKSVREEIARGEIGGVAQSLEGATYRPRRQPQDGIIDWHRSAHDIQNWIRAQATPYPGAYTFFEGGKLIIWVADIPDQTRRHEGKEPGTVVKTSTKGIDVAVSDGIVRLQRVQPENRPQMWANEFADRYEITEGRVFNKAHAPSSWLYTGVRNSNGGTDFSNATNLSIGEQTQIQAVVQTGAAREVLVEAHCSDNQLISKSLHAEDDERTPVRFEPEDNGTHTLAVEFYHDGEQIDTRYLKLFVH